MAGDEVIVAAERGVFILKYDRNKRHLTVNLDDPVLREEFAYLKGELVSQVFEFETGQIFTSVFHSSQYRIINRLETNKDKIIYTLPSDKMVTEGCTDIDPLPGFDPVHFPYCITRSQFSINLLDTKNKQVYCLLLDKNPEFDNEFMSIV